jgi:site-specific recombinase XerD
MNSTSQPIRPTSVPDAVQAFEAHLRFKRKAGRTIIQYRPVLRAFSAWAGDRSPGSISTFEIQGFLEHWLTEFLKRNGREPSASAMKGVIVALRSLYAYLYAYGLLLNDGRHVPNPTLAIEVPVIEQKQNDWLRQAEDEALLAASMSTEDERIIVWFLRWSGLRIGEALSLSITDVDLGEGLIYVRKSKTPRGKRAVPIAPELRLRITRWLEVLVARGLYDPSGPFFPTKTGKAWSSQFAEKIVRRVAYRAGVREVECTCGSSKTTKHEKGCPRTQTGQRLSAVTPHTLRRTFGSYFLNQGVRLEVVSTLLGHSSTQITERAYAELQAQTIRKEMLAALGG